MLDHGGSEWIKSQMHCNHPDFVMSELGSDVADLLGNLFLGIYHLDHKRLYKTDWANKNYIEYSLGWKSLSTYDFDELTRLVFLGHEMSIRVSIEPCNFHFIKLVFHRRQKEGDKYHRHPSLDEAVKSFRAFYLLEETKEVEAV